MALGFLYGAGGGGGGNEPNPIVIAGNVVNYRHDATLLSGTDSVYFTGGQTPYVYDVDFTDIGSLEIVTKGGYGYGAYLMLTINGQNISKQYSGSAYETMVFDVSAYTGINSIKISYTSSGNRCDISSMTLGKRPDAKFPVIYDHGSWSVGYDNSGRSWGSYTSNPFVISSDCVYNSSGTACISTANAIDLSNYTTLHVLVKRTNTNNYSDGICISTTNSVNNQVANVVFSNLAANTPVEVTLDITSLSSGYVVLHCDTTGWYVYKIWLT